MITLARWVKKDRRIYEFSCCAACGTGWGSAPGDAKAGHMCDRTICLACCSPQCMRSGLGRGQCSICYVGLLPGWSGSDHACDYKGCAERAVARVGGINKHVCFEHLKRKKEAKYVMESAERVKRDFVLVPEMTEIESSYEWRFNIAAEGGDRI